MTKRRKLALLGLATLAAAAFAAASVRPLGWHWHKGTPVAGWAWDDRASQAD